KPKDVLVFYVNGTKVTEPHPEPETSLIVYLRTKLRLTGTKLGCSEGGCGACTVMVSKWDRLQNRIVHFSVNSCLAPVVSMHDCAVTTVEGIGSTKTKLHAVQERLWKFHGSQCGFCTPGIVMSMYALLRNNSSPKMPNIETCLQGNLCRCTGYRPILGAFKTFTENKTGCPMGKLCCKNAPPSEDNPENDCSDCYKPYDPSQEPIFPPELLISSRNHPVSPLKFVGERVTWYRPTTLDQLTDLKEKYPDAHLVVGNTEIGIETGVKGRCYPVIVTPAAVEEISFVKYDQSGIEIGASCILSNLVQQLNKIVEEKGGHLTQPLSAILEMLHWFAGDQIRNVAVIGGNIMTASPISDLNPILMACCATATFMLHSRGTRKVPMDQSFFPSYRKTCATKGEVLLSVRIPFMRKGEYMKAYMQSKRREDDIAIVNAALRVKFYPGSRKVEEFSAAFGGMAATSVMAKNLMENIIGREWKDDLIDDVSAWMREDFKLEQNAPGGMVEYREALTLSFFFKFYIHIKDCLCKEGATQDEIAPEEECTKVPLGGNHHVSPSTQTWEEVPENQPKDDSVGRPLPHSSGQLHVTGEAKYIDDITPHADELYMCLVTSTRCHAYVRDVNLADAMTSPGYVTYVDHRDIPGSNECGVMNGDLVFANGKVTCVGQVIGAVIADTCAHAQRAAQLVKITYEDIFPRILTIEDAIKHESFHKILHLNAGDAAAALDASEYVIEGEIRIAGQEHFYLETQACLVVPQLESDQMEIYASSQSPTFLQDNAASVLGIENNKVIVRVKRMGGGFGGKETRFVLVSNPAVVAAKKCGRPIRCMLTRQEDMLISGQRHSFYAKYKVGFTKEGKLTSLVNNIYSNAGNSLDLSISVMERALYHSGGCYRIPNISIAGHVCKTNVSSNTAFRGFGAPQAMLIAEDWISGIAAKLGISGEKVREINMYKEGDNTYYGQVLECFNLPRCWQECRQKSNFNERKEKIEEYNSKNRWRKRGISCIPTMFGISFTGFFLNQAGALVQVYKDGSVLLTHGGTEMGQGLHTKMIQVASTCLGIPASRIHISSTSTETVPNTSPTAASVGSDINGMAIKEACEKILGRLKPLRENLAELSWDDLIMKAYLERISLSATGFYKTPDIYCNWDQKSGECFGRPFDYFTYGAAVSEVEIDCLTGDHVVLQTDIVMDVGGSLNPAVDIGQIEGAFMQGYGMMMLEEPLINIRGELLTRGPGAYKIPGFGDCPRRFNVHLLQNSRNKRAIFSSKARFGEPPLFLSASVFFAVKNAVESARKHSGLFGAFRMDSPATCERIRMWCGDQFTKQYEKHTQNDENVKPWSFQA
uniref:Xanthine dehydrogenase/oxidase n=1 Tax=Ciona savignyi TaxID=51511 RepID=H2YN14_CIOSA